MRNEKLSSCTQFPVDKRLIKITNVECIDDIEGNINLWCRNAIDHKIVLCV